MTTLIVPDGSAVVALLTDPGPNGEWVAEVTQDAALVAPALLLSDVSR